MNTLKLLIPLLSFSILVGFSNVMGQGELKAVNDGRQLVERGGLHYKVNSETPFSGTAVAKYENGQKRRQEIYKAGKKDGLLAEWYENGQKKAETTYEDGDWKMYNTWYENGQKKMEAIRDGLRTTWYENGQKKSEEPYKGDKKDGVFIAWHENGQKDWEERYKDGKMDIPYVDSILVGSWVFDPTAKEGAQIVVSKRNDEFSLKFYDYNSGGITLSREAKGKRGADGYLKVTALDDSSISWYVSFTKGSMVTALNDGDPHSTYGWTRGKPKTGISIGE